VSAVWIAPLQAAHARLGLTLLDQAFAADPSLGWYLFAQRPGYAQRRRAYLDAYHAFHQHNALPILAAWQGEALLGVSYFSPGSHSPDAPSLHRLGRAIEQHCGADCLNRLDQLLEAFEQQLPRADLARIEFIAVANGFQGQGIGSALLAASLAWLRQNGCPGVALETGEARNLPLYQRHGLQRVGVLQLPGLRQHYLLQRWA
jgi:GNAT superfamily N-acetyltransferase